MFAFSLCSIFSSSGAVDANLIACTILRSTSLPILTPILVTVSFKREVYVRTEGLREKARVLVECKEQ